MWALVYVSIVGMSIHDPIEYRREIQGFFYKEADCVAYAVERNYQPFTQNNLPYYACEKR